MVRKLMSLLYTEVRGLHEAAYLLGFFALLSQVLALVRDRLLAATFGAGAALDVYYAAFRIPDFLFAAIASFVSVYVLIPFITERLSESPKSAREFLSGAFTFYTVTIAAAALVAAIFAPYLLSLLYPGFSEESRETLTLMTRIILLQPVFLGLSNLLATITQIRQRFVVYAASPVLYNVGIILGVMFLYPLWGPVGLALGVVLGALLHLAIQLPYILTDPIAPRWLGRIDFSLVGRIMAVSLPRTIALTSQQIAFAILLAVASLSAAGSITVFTLAYNLQSVPLAIIGVSYSVAAFPTLAKLFSAGDRETFLLQISTAARHVVFWSIPVVVLFVVLRAQIVRVIFGAGEFSWTDTRLTAAALALFTLSLTAHALVLLLVRGYYAAGNTRTPLIINVLSTAFGVGMALVLFWLFTTIPSVQQSLEELLRVENLPGTEIMPLALGYSLGVIANALILLIVFSRDFAHTGLSLARAFLTSMSGSLAMGAMSYVMLNVLDSFLDINTFLGIFTQGLLAGLSGVLLWLVVLRLFGSSELEEAWAAFSRRIFKTKTVVPEQQEM